MLTPCVGKYCKSSKFKSQLHQSAKSLTINVSEERDLIKTRKQLLIMSTCTPVSNICMAMEYRAKSSTQLNLNDAT